MKRPSVVISGSFRKHFAQIKEIGEAFASLGITILSPELSEVVNPGDEFAILETDDTADPKVLQQRHFDAISKADALYLCDPGGYVGASATSEVGWALAKGTPIFALEEPEDFMLKLFVNKVGSPYDVAAEIDDSYQRLLDALESWSSIPQLQSYIHDVVEHRGFADETPRDIMLLMVEEVGELAKAIRKISGLKTDTQKQDVYNRAEDEMADVFIYLLDLANSLEIDLLRAFRAKEHQNHSRTWK